MTKNISFVNANYVYLITFNQIISSKIKHAMKNIFFCIRGLDNFSYYIIYKCISKHVKKLILVKSANGLSEYYRAFKNMIFKRKYIERYGRKTFISRGIFGNITSFYCLNVVVRDGLIFVRKK